MKDFLKGLFIGLSGMTAFCVGMFLTCGIYNDLGFIFSIIGIILGISGLFIYGRIEK